MQARAAVWEGLGKPIETTDVEVLVDVKASGVCHTDLSVDQSRVDFLVLQQMPTNIEHPMHHTDTLNFQIFNLGPIRPR